MAETLFTAQEWLRYTRHIQLSDIGAKGQAQLKKAHILIVGMGGLGCPAALYLAAAGVGHLTLIDGDHVDLTNLQRQVLYNVDDVGQSKTAVAQKKLQALNPEITIDAIGKAFDVDTVEDIETPDFIVDCTDNFSTRYLINDFCLQKSVPWIYASVNQFAGQCALFTPGNACFRCLFPEPPSESQDCNQAGVLGVLPGILGLFQVNEVIKFITGLPTPLNNHLMLFNAKTLSMQKITLATDAGCICQTGSFTIDRNNPDYTPVCASDQQNLEDHSISIENFNEQRNQETSYVLDVRTAEEHQNFHIGGRNIPLDDLEYHVEKIDKNQRYLCYCQSGMRSEQAAKRLRQSGFEAASLRGGLAAWLKEMI